MKGQAYMVVRPHSFLFILGSLKNTKSNREEAEGRGRLVPMHERAATELLNCDSKSARDVQVLGMRDSTCDVARDLRPIRITSASARERSEFWPDMPGAWKSCRSRTRVQSGSGYQRQRLTDKVFGGTTETGRPRGSDAGEKIKGCKQHMAVDVEGSPIAIQAPSAAQCPGCLRRGDRTAPRAGVWCKTGKPAVRLPSVLLREADWPSRGLRRERAATARRDHSGTRFPQRLHTRFSRCSRQARMARFTQSFASTPGCRKARLQAMPARA